MADSKKVTKHYIIAGDSWGCGEWDFVDGRHRVVHTGIAQYLEESGVRVTNISGGGLSNLDIVGRIDAWLERFPDQVPDKILVFQTKYTRDHKHLVSMPPEPPIAVFSDIASRWISRFYMRLSEISTIYYCPIHIIGGASDTMWFDNMSQHYPGCTIACQSAVNLLLHESHRIDKPVFSWYANYDQPFVMWARPQVPDPTDIIDAINLGFERDRHVAENPDLFFPDGRHPNRHGYKILFDFLKSQNTV